MPESKKKTLPLTELFENHIKDTPPKSKEILLKEIKLCDITIAVRDSLKMNGRKVYVTSKALKHCYDNRKSSSKMQFEIILKHIPKVIKYPSYITENKPGQKRATHCFIKKIKDADNEYEIICMLEKKTLMEFSGERDVFYFVTAFVLTDPEYIRKCKLIWSWEDGDSSS